MAGNAHPVGGGIPSASHRAALAYQQRGWPIFPVRGKEPATKHGVLDASTDPRKAAIWFERWPELGVALATGKPSGIWVLDLDDDLARQRYVALRKEHGDDILTVTSQTARGWHLFFQMPEDGRDVRNSASKIADKVDVRGTGGYVVLPPSPHPDGKAYQWFPGRSPDEIGVAAAPAWLVDLAAPASEEGGKRRTSAERAPAIGDEIPAGNRNAVLTSLGGTMRRRGMREEEIFKALQAVNEGRCSPPLDETEVWGIARSVARYEPEAVPRARDAGLPPPQARGSRSSRSGPGIEWPERPQVPGPPEPDPLPLDALPLVLRAMARTISEATQAPRDSAIAAALGGVSVAIVGRAEVEICPRRGWKKPAQEYIAIHQASGTGKSPLIGFVRAPIEAWEARRSAEEAPRRRWAEEAVQVQTERVSTLRKAAARDASPGKRDELEAALNDLARAEESPRGAFQLLISDATEEEVVRVLAGNGGRAASVDPEGTILEVAAGRYGNGDARLAALTHGWDGEAMRVNRVTRARVDLPSANLALLLGLQPGILEGMLNAETMKQRGVLARFLWVAPTIRWDEMLTGGDVPDLDRAAVERYDRAVTRILDSSDSSEPPHVLRMSPEAQEGIYRLEKAKVDGMRPGGPLASVPSFAGKLPDHGARVAALLAVADRADREEDLYRDPIPGWAMEAAERLVGAIATHVVKVIGDWGGDSLVSDLRYLLDLAVEMEGETESDIRERARARQRFRDADHVRELFDTLGERGCIRRVPRAPRGGPGRPPSPEIRVHPALRHSDKSDKTTSPPLERNKSDKSEASPAPESSEELTEEDRQHLEDERAGMQTEDPLAEEVGTNV